MRENEAQNAENGSNRTRKFMMRKDEVKIKLPEQGATRARGVFQQPVSTPEIVFDLPVKFILKTMEFTSNRSCLIAKLSGTTEQYHGVSVT
jgi:hypothetical protein